MNRQRNIFKLITITMVSVLILSIISNSVGAEAMLPLLIGFSSASIGGVFVPNINKE